MPNDWSRRREEENRTVYITEDRKMLSISICTFRLFQTLSGGPIWYCLMCYFRPIDQIIPTFHNRLLLLLSYIHCCFYHEYGMYHAHAGARLFTGNQGAVTWLPVHIQGCLNSVVPGSCEWNFRSVIFKVISVLDGWGIVCEIAFRWMSLDLTDDNSTLVQVMAWCHQATSHYLNHNWPRYLTP